MKTEIKLLALVVILTVAMSSVAWDTAMSTIMYTCEVDDMMNMADCSSVTDCSDTDISVTVQESSCMDTRYNITLLVNGSFKTNYSRIIDTCASRFEDTLANQILYNCTSAVESPSQMECRNQTFSEVLAQLTNCGSLLGEEGEVIGVLCAVLITLGCVVTALVFIIMILCLVITCLVARGRQYRYSPTAAAVAQSPSDPQLTQTQPQEQRETENQTLTDTDTQQVNLYHVLDPQYDTVENNRGANKVVDVGVAHYSEPDHTHAAAKPQEHETLPKTGAQSTKSKLSQDKTKDNPPGTTRYEELSGPGHGKMLTSMEVAPSTSSSPPAIPKYSSLHLEDDSEEDKLKELKEMPLYSMPDMIKKKTLRQKKENEMATSQVVGVDMMSNEKTPSPPPPLLPPKPGQASNAVEEGRQEEVEEEEAAYAEVSSRPSQWKSQTSYGGGATQQQEHMAQTHKMPHAAQQMENKASKYPRSYSLDDFIAAVEPSSTGTRKASDYELPILYDEPLNLALHSSVSIPHEGAKKKKEEGTEEDILGYFM